MPESVAKPLDYYMNNIVNSTNLIDKAIKADVERFIFSSTAAVYGEPDNIPEAGLDESFPTNPINPYGMSKLMSENVLKDASLAYPSFKHVAFRYFNVAGADIHYSKDGLLRPRIGQSFPNATHLIKIASECAEGKREKMAIFGNDFATEDGTGVRDYIHIDDLASAHIEAIEYLKDNDSDTFNVGYGKGYSVKEVIERVKEVTESDFIVENAPRRAGDPATLISNNSKIRQKMNWTPKYNDLGLICQSAYEWEKRLR
ncbi:UDP-glucose 4-epimerase [hydrothermal vent metagenome]|uniref:UDP-glucose 4-epimerase n=1 Tax=hydrothermal vent metagenome TaxID=652676 RepID=A0A1W1BYG3_9ZZZZ